MAVDNGYGTRWLDSDNVAKYRHEVVFYVFEFACEIINLPMMLLFFFVASYQKNSVLTTHWQSYLERLQNVSELHNAKGEQRHLDSQGRLMDNLFEIRSQSVDNSQQ